MLDGHTVTVTQDADGYMDIRNASMYTGVSAMALRTHISSGDLTSVKRCALDYPTGRIKIWLKVEDLDTFMAKRKALLACRNMSVQIGGSVCFKARRIKSVIYMLHRDTEIGPQSRAVAVSALMYLLEKTMRKFGELERPIRDNADGPPF